MREEEEGGMSERGGEETNYQVLKDRNVCMESVSVSAPKRLVEVLLCSILNLILKCHETRELLGS